MPAPTRPVSRPDAAPLGLAGFGTTTFMLSFFYVGVDPSLTPAIFPVALFFGGLIQLIAGLVEFRQGSTFGATAFSSYGAFWVAFAIYGMAVLPDLPPDQIHIANGLFNLPWAVLTFYLTIATLRITGVLLAAFTSATTTFTLFTAANFAQSEELFQVAGSFGFITAAIAWYASFAGLINGTWGRHLIPTFPDPGKRLAHLGHHKSRPGSVTSSAGERELRTEDASPPQA
ncbi:acetate uptake transporter [Streptomyces sp. NPDC086077]|uniref:acetate uptake transporter n=1 Tax=Streptomyces sp. NPDC086077 TaxID=3154862 RepID=UPI00342F4D84